MIQNIVIIINIIENEPRKRSIAGNAIVSIKYIDVTTDIEVIITAEMAEIMADFCKKRLSVIAKRISWNNM